MNALLQIDVFCNNTQTDDVLIYLPIGLGNDPTRGIKSPLDISLSIIIPPKK